MPSSLDRDCSVEMVVPSYLDEGRSVESVVLNEDCSVETVVPSYEGRSV